MEPNITTHLKPLIGFHFKQNEYSPHRSPFLFYESQLHLYIYKLVHEWSLSLKLSEHSTADIRLLPNVYYIYILLRTGD